VKGSLEARILAKADSVEETRHVIEGFGNTRVNNVKKKGQCVKTAKMQKDMESSKKKGKK
jgi:hypothetical protein